MFKQQYMDIVLEDINCWPHRADEDSAGIDLRSSEELVITPGDYAKISTGVRVAIPDFHFGLVAPRSSVGVRGLVLMNTVGIIDSSYRGIIYCVYKNVGDDIVHIEQFERIAQLLIIPYNPVQLMVVPELNETARGEGGFGSTGKK